LTAVFRISLTIDVRAFATASMHFPFALSVPRSIEPSTMPVLLPI